MIQLRLHARDLARLRFAYSPLAEVTRGIHTLTSGRVELPMRGWQADVEDRVRTLDMEFLAEIVPAQAVLANFLFVGATHCDTTIESQLEQVGRISAEMVRVDLEQVWHGRRKPSHLRDLLATPDAGRGRIVEALWSFWQAALEPHWVRMRAVLDADVAHRARRITSGGIENLLVDLHPELSLDGVTLRIEKPHFHCEQDLSGASLTLVPSVFAWPNLIVETGHHGAPSLTYGARGVGTLWGAEPREEADDEALAALLGRRRASLLRAVVVPGSTTALAADLGQSPAAVSGHLSVLRRCGLVTSWRSGRRVLYQGTPLATSVLAAIETPHRRSTSA